MARWPKAFWKKRRDRSHVSVSESRKSIRGTR
jgi:hypothetical protein